MQKRRARMPVPVLDFILFVIWQKRSGTLSLSSRNPASERRLSLPRVLYSGYWSPLLGLVDLFIMRRPPDGMRIFSRHPLSGALCSDTDPFSSSVRLMMFRKPSPFLVFFVSNPFPSSVMTSSIKSAPEERTISADRAPEC